MLESSGLQLRQVDRRRSLLQQNQNQLDQVSADLSSSSIRNRIQIQSCRSSLPIIFHQLIPSSRCFFFFCLSGPKEPLRCDENLRRIKASRGTRLAGYMLTSL